MNFYGFEFELHGVSSDIFRSLHSDPLQEEIRITGSHSQREIKNFNIKYNNLNGGVPLDNSFLMMQCISKQAEPAAKAYSETLHRWFALLRVKKGDWLNTLMFATDTGFRTGAYSHVIATAYDDD